MDISTAILLAVALGEARPAAEARITAAFPELAPPPAPGPKDVIGFRSEIAGNAAGGIDRVETEILADGTEREKGRVEVKPPPPARAQ